MSDAEVHYLPAPMMPTPEPPPAAQPIQVVTEEAIRQVAEQAIAQHLSPEALERVARQVVQEMTGNVRRDLRGDADALSLQIRASLQSVVEHAARRPVQRKVKHDDDGRISHIVRSDGITQTIVRGADGEVTGVLEDETRTSDLPPSAD